MATNSVMVKIMGDASGFTGATRTVKRDMDAMKTGVLSTSGAVSQLKGALAGVALGGAMALAAAVVGIAKASLDASIQMEQLNRKFTVFTGSAQAAAAEIAFVRDQANRLGLDVLVLTDNYANFLNAIKGTANEGEKGRAAFVGLSEGMAAIGMTADQQSRAWAQLNQGIMKGKFEMEDLKTINEAGLPIFKLLAQALGITTKELLDMQSKGKLLVEDVLPLLGKGMHDVYGEAAANNVKTAAGQIALFNNNLLDTKKALGDDLLPLFTEIMRLINEMSKGLLGFLKKAEEVDKISAGRRLLQSASPALGLALGLAKYNSPAAAETSAASTAPAAAAAAVSGGKSDLANHEKEAEKAAKAAEDWRAKLADLRTEIDGLNPTLNEYDKKILAINNKYDDAIVKFPTHREALEALRSEYIKQVQVSEQAAEAKRNELELMKRESSEQQRLNQLRDQYYAITEAMQLTAANGGDNSQLATQAVQIGYDLRRVELQEQMANAEKTQNGVMEGITRQAMTQLDLLYAQKDANTENMNRLKDVLGIQREITAEKQNQSESLLDEYNASIVQTRTRDEQYKTDFDTVYRTATSGALAFYGATWIGYVRDQAKQRIAEYDQLKRQERLVEEQKRTIESVGKASDELASAAVELANSGRTLADSLRSASRNITSAQVDIAGGAASVLSPEQQYQLAQSMFINTAAQAQSTGDVELFNALPELAKQFMEASQGYFASGTQFAADYAMVQAILGESSVSASSYADSTQTVVDLLGTQNEILTAIKTALETGGDTASLLSQLNTVNGQIKSATDNVNTSVGGVTTAAYNINTTTANGTTSVTGWLNSLNNTTGGVTTATTSGTTSVTSWLSSVRDQAANTATYTAATKDRLNNSMLGSQLPGRINSATTTPLNAGQTIDWGSKTAYTYFAKGGIAYEPSIFGEAGPEAAVPLPDGRSIPVTLSRSDNYGDTSALLVELRSLRADVNQLRQESVGELREIKSPLRRAVAGR